MFENLDLSPKNCGDCNRWLGVKNKVGICGAINESTITMADHIGCDDQLSTKMIRASYRFTELQPRIKQIANEIEMRETQKVMTKLESVF